MKPINPTVPFSSSFAPSALPDPITQLFQKFAPYGSKSLNSFFDARFLMVILTFSTIAYVFYRIFHRAKVESPKEQPPVDPLLSQPLEILLKDSILELKRLQDQNQLSEMENPPSLFARYFQAIVHKFENDRHMRTTFGNLLRNQSLHHLSLDDLCHLYKALEPLGTHPTFLLVIELLWEKVEDSNDFIKQRLPYPLFCAQSVKEMIAGQTLINIPDPEQDPFFLALVLQSAPNHSNASVWNKKIKNLLTSRHDVMDFLKPPKEDYKIRVQDLEAQNSAESMWAQRRLEAYRYLTSVQKT